MTEEMSSTTATSEQLSDMGKVEEGLKAVKKQVALLLASVRETNESVFSPTKERPCESEDQGRKQLENRFQMMSMDIKEISETLYEASQEIDMIKKLVR